MCVCVCVCVRVCVVSEWEGQCVGGYVPGGTPLVQMSGAHAKDTTGVGSGNTRIRKGGACAVLPVRVGVSVKRRARSSARLGLRLRLGSGNTLIGKTVLAPFYLLALV